MFSVFPELLSFAFAVPFFLRLTIGIFFILEGIALIKKLQTPEADLLPTHRFIMQMMVLVQLAGGALLVTGLYTQPAGILLAGVSYALIRLQPIIPTIAPRERVVYIFAGIIAFSLLFLGPGIFSIDFPL